MSRKTVSQPKFDKKSREEDLVFLIKKIERIHKNPYKHIEKQSFEESLQKSLTVKDEYFALAIQESLSLIKDAHTRIDLIRDDLLPFYLTYLADEHFYITGSSNKEIIGSYIISINNHSIKEITQRVSNLSSKENNEQLLHDLERFLPSNRILKYYGFSNSKDVEIETNKGFSTFTEDSGFSIKRRNPFKWKKNTYTGIWNYRFKAIDQNLLFQYNDCDRGEYTKKRLKDFKTKLLAEANKARNIIVDLRQNTGGDTEIMRDALDKLPSNIPIYVATGRRTFSSAMHHLIDLKERQGAIQIGENAGQKPNRFGQGEKIVLPNSQIIVTCSCKYFELMPGSNLQVLEPDIYLPLTITDYISETDPLNKWMKDNLN